MQEYKVIISESAKNDLSNIYDYVLDISSTQNAEHVMRYIAEKVVSFNFAPERTEPFARDAHGRPVRATVSGKYRIIYVVNRESHEVIIARVVYVGRDLELVLGDR